MAEVLMVLSLAHGVSWASLCKDINVELREAVRSELITERQAREIRGRCREYERREAERSSK